VKIEIERHGKRTLGRGGGGGGVSNPLQGRGIIPLQQGRCNLPSTVHTWEYSG